MTDMVGHEAIEYAARKGHERRAEIEILQRAAELGAPLGVVHEYAKRLAQLQLRDHDYKQASATFLAGLRASGVISPSYERSALTSHAIGDELAKLAHFYRGVFCATEARRLLDKWDAEDAVLGRRA